MTAREEPGQLQGFRLDHLGWKRVPSLPVGLGGGGGGQRAEACRWRPSETLMGSGIEEHQASESRRAWEMQIQESAAAIAGGANRNPQGVQWGEREGEFQALRVPPPSPRAQGEDRDRTGKQSQRGLLQEKVCKPFSFRREAGPQRPWGAGRRCRPLTGRSGRKGGEFCLGPRLGGEGYVRPSAGALNSRALLGHLNFLL